MFMFAFTIKYTNSKNLQVVNCPNAVSCTPSLHVLVCRVKASLINAHLEYNFRTEAKIYEYDLHKIRQR